MFKLLIRSREALIYEGDCATVTSFNDIGEFDVLEHHANFITMIKKFIVINKGEESEKKIAIEKGVLTANEDLVQVFIQD